MIAGALASANEEGRRKPNPVARMVGLERAGELLGRGGQKVIADALGIDPRALRYKNAGDATITDGDLRSAASALEEVAARLIDHAHKLREEALPRPAAAMPVTF
jgi:hypothetical protein